MVVIMTKGKTREYLQDIRNPAREVQKFWNDQADKHSTDLDATNPDVLAKELELQALKKSLDSSVDTLEAGCGNGYNLIHLGATLRGRLVGFDFASSMIEAANKARAQMEDPGRFAFHVKDVLENLEDLGTFDQIYTDRCLINLSSLELQLQAVGNLARSLNPGGRLILVESTQQGQERINGLRERVGLDPIPYHWHNLYLDEDRFLAEIPSSLKHAKTENFASLYFAVSRVLNAKLTPEGEEPDYRATVNKIAFLLPSFGNYGPLKLFLFEKSS